MGGSGPYIDDDFVVTHITKHQGKTSDGHSVNDHWGNTSSKTLLNRHSGDLKGTGYRGDQKDRRLNDTGGNRREEDKTPDARELNGYRGIHKS